MDATLEVIRQQMNETRSQLSDKLDSLEHQVSETVQTTGTAVNATVAAVQETVETVTDAVHEAVQSVSHALDVRRQINRHPWLALGGAIAAGYLAAGFLNQRNRSNQPGKKSGQPQEAAGATSPVEDISRNGNGQPAVQSAANGAALAAAYESGVRSSAWRQLRSVAIGALIGIVQDVAARAVPQVMGYFHPDKATTGAVSPDAPATDVADKNGQKYE